MQAQTQRSTYHPNRATTTATATRVAIVALLLVSALLLVVITIAAWEQLAGGRAFQLAAALLYLATAYFVGRWHRGILPLAAAIALALTVFAIVSGPGWFMRDKPGIAAPHLGDTAVGILVLLLIPLQLLLIAFTLRGFFQQWHVEAARPVS